MIQVKTFATKSLNIPLPVLIGGGVSGLGVVLIVGLISGLVLRPNNCIQPITSPTTSLTTSSTFETASSTISTSTNIPTTTITKASTTATTSRLTSTASTSRSTTSRQTSTASTSRSTTSRQTSTASTSRSTTSRQTSTASTSRSTTSRQTSTASTSRSTTSRQTSTTSTSRSTSTRQTTSTTTSPITSTTKPTTSTTRYSTATKTLPSISSSPPKPTTTPISLEDVRLPNKTQPTHYELLIRAYFEPKTSQPDISREFFSGSVKINIKIVEETSSIILHADRSLLISKTSLKTEDGNDIVIQKENRLPFQQYEILASTNLTQGNYVLSMEFNGTFGPVSNLVGFYRSRYTEDGIIKTVLATKFEPIDARKAFPCFDEPKFKTTYDITVEHPLNTIAISNWPIATEPVTSGERITTTFKRTFPMPTYLPAWIITPDDYDYISGNLNDGTEVRIYGRKSAVENSFVDFALEVSIKITEFFKDEYFNNTDAIPPKIDLIAVPDFSAGAMENWGSIIFRETALYFNETVNSLDRKQAVAGIIAHELAHFWFGNLVTCAWWDDLWLNEAMATFLQYKSMQNVYPELDLIDQFIGTTLVPVMYDDGYESSHPVSVNINNPEDIGSLFSSITYDKGCAVLRMLESTVGENVFRDGLRNYIKNLANGSGVASEFYSTLKMPNEMEDEGVSAQEYIETWLLQINYPEVDIRIDNTENETNVNFVQDRFLLSVYDESFIQNIPSPFNYTWKIYLQCKAGMLTGEVDEFNFYLGKKTGNKKLEKRYDWVKCNRDFNGFYVNNYDADDYKNIINTLINHPDSFSIGDRANLIHVAYSLAFKGSLKYNTAAYLSSYLENHEEDYVPWKVFFWHMGKLSQILEHRPVFDTLRRYGVSLVKPLAEKIDIWNDDGEHTERLLKINMIEFMCRLQDGECLRNTTNYFKSVPVDYFNNPVDNAGNNMIPPNYRGSSYKFHIQNTYDYWDWFNLNELYLSTVDPQERAVVISSLSFSRLLWIIDIYLQELLKENSRIKPQDFFDVLSYVGRNPSGRHVVWAFVRENWYKIVGYFGNSRALNRAIKNICESFDNPFLLEEVLIFFDSTPAGSGSILRSQTIEIVANNIFWVIDHEKELNEAFFIPF